MGLYAIILLSIIGVSSPFIVLNILFKNPYLLTLVVGKKGSGKSTLLTKLAYKYTKKKIDVYVNCSLNLPDKCTPYLHYIGALDLWLRREELKNSIVLLDETGLDFNCREWDSFPKELKYFFCFQRKLKCTVYLFSQSLDCDKTIRDKCDNLLLTKCNGWLAYARYINRNITITQANDKNGSSLVDQLKFAPLLLPSSYIFTLVPLWKKYFNTTDMEFVESITKRQTKKK